jgi:hypothetical protein
MDRECRVVQWWGAWGDCGQERSVHQAILRTCVGCSPFALISPISLASTLTRPLASLRHKTLTSLSTSPPHLLPQPSTNPSAPCSLLLPHTRRHLVARVRSFPAPALSPFRPVLFSSSHPLSRTHANTPAASPSYAARYHVRSPPLSDNVQRLQHPPRQRAGARGWARG